MSHTLLDVAGEGRNTVVAAPVLGDLLYGNDVDSWQKLAGNTTTTRNLLRQTGDGTLSAAPVWDTLQASDIASGTLAVARGGTGLASGTSGGVLGYTAAGTLASSVLLTTNALLLGGGAGATPTPMSSLGTTTTVLHGDASGAPTFSAVSLTADVSGTLPVANGGTGITALGTGVATFLATPSSANLLAAITDETGTGLNVFGTSPTFTTSIIMADAADIVVNATTGTKIGTATTQKLGFFNAAPVVQQTALTVQSTTITHTAPGTNDFAIQALTQTTPFGFVTSDEGNTVLLVIANLQTRVAEIQTKLQALGFLA